MLPRLRLPIRCAAKNFFRQRLEPRVPVQIKHGSGFILIRKPAGRLALTGAETGQQRRHCSGCSTTASSLSRAGQRHRTIAVMRPGGDVRVPPSAANRMSGRATACEEHGRWYELLHVSKSGANAITRSYGLDTVRSDCTNGDGGKTQRAGAPGDPAQVAQVYFRISCRGGLPVCGAPSGLSSWGSAASCNAPVFSVKTLTVRQKKCVYEEFIYCFWRTGSYHFHGNAEGRFDRVEGWVSAGTLVYWLYRSWIVIGGSVRGVESTCPRSS